MRWTSTRTSRSCWARAAGHTRARSAARQRPTSTATSGRGAPTPPRPSRGMSAHQVTYVAAVGQPRVGRSCGGAGAGRATSLAVIRPFFPSKVRWREMPDALRPCPRGRRTRHTGGVEVAQIASSRMARQGCAARSPASLPGCRTGAFHGWAAARDQDQGDCGRSWRMPSITRSTFSLKKATRPAIRGHSGTGSR